MNIEDISLKPSIFNSDNFEFSELQISIYILIDNIS